MFLCDVLVGFLILSCLPRGDPGGQANLEKSWKTIGFLDEFAWVPFLRQVQREQLSEHRRTKNGEKNKSRNSPRDARKNASTFDESWAKMAPKTVQNRSQRLPEGQRDTKRRQEPPKRDQKRPKSTPRAPQEHPKSDFFENPAPSGRVRPALALGRKARASAGQVYAFAVDALQGSYA